MKHERIFALLTEIITGICAHKDSLKIFPESYNGNTHKLIVMPHMADYRKLVGKGGRTVKALQLLTKSIGNQHGLSLTLDLQESFVGAPEPHTTPEFNHEFDQAKLEKLVADLAEWVFARPVPVETTSRGDNLLDVRVNAPADDNSQVLMAAINTIFYPYGRANGRVVEVRQKQ